MATILIVEDEPQLREMLFDHLVDEGHSPFEAGNGKDAIDVYAYAKPDLIISDINMPVMDGYQFLKTLQAEYPEVEDIPFFFLSASDTAEDQIKGLNFGIDEYLCKPVDFGILTARIELALARQRKMKKKIDQVLAASKAKAKAAKSHKKPAPKSLAHSRSLHQVSSAEFTSFGLLASKRLKLTTKQQEDIKSINTLSNLHSASLINKIGRKVNISRLFVKKEKYDFLVEEIELSEIDEDFFLEMNKLFYFTIANFLSRRRYLRERAFIIPTLFDYVNKEKIRAKIVEITKQLQERFSVSIITEIVNVNDRISTCQDMLQDLSVSDQLHIVEIKRLEQISSVNLGDLHISTISMNYEAATELSGRQIEDLKNLLRDSDISLYIKEIPEGKLSHAQMIDADLLSVANR